MVTEGGVFDCYSVKFKAPIAAWLPFQTIVPLAVIFVERNIYQNLAEDHGRKPVGESVPLKQMKEIV